MSIEFNRPTKINHVMLAFNLISGCICVVQAVRNKRAWDEMMAKQEFNYAAKSYAHDKLHENTSNGVYDGLGDELGERMKQDYELYQLEYDLKERSNES